MKIKIIVFSLILSIILTGCGKGNNDKPDVSEQNNTQEVSTPKERKKPKEKEINYGIVTVDKVRLRESNSINSKVIDELPIWSELIILGKSEKKESIGQYNDYWYKVQYKESIGWCYGGLLINIREVSSQQVEQLKESFDNCQSFYNAKNILKAIALATKDEKLIDIGVRRLLQLQEKYGEKLCDKTLCNIERIVFWRYSSDELNNPKAIKENNLKEYIIQIKNEGFIIKILEGNPTLQVNPKRILKDFGDFISKRYNEYLTLKSEEIENPVGDEGFILITWDELADRLAKWAKYIEKHPNTIEAEDAKDEYYYTYLYIYTHGTHNTPIYNEKNKLSEEVKDSYKYFIENYEEIGMSKNIKELYEIYRKNKFEKNGKINTYLEKLFS